MNSPIQRGKKTVKKSGLSIYEITIFGMLGGVMYASKVIMEVLPNIHLLGMFTMTFALVYRVKGLVPLYVYILLNGMFSGFALWWIPYLYIWTILWGITMLLPKNMPDKICRIVYPIICSLHGLAFGTLYAPMQAILFHLSFKQMLVWIAVGFPYDCVHAVGNLVAGALVFPLAKLLRKIDKNLNK